MQNERVASCGRPLEGTVGIAHSAGSGCAHFNGIIRCGSVWTCPVCAAAIAERRRIEVRELIDEHGRRGGSIYMATLTIPHGRHQTAVELRECVAKTWGKVQQGSPWKRAKAAAGIVGTVRALEVTYSDQNGWHPHIHVLFFVEFGTTAEAVEDFELWLFERWADKVEAAGFGVCQPSAFDFQLARSSDEAGDYVAKWGADRELVSGHTKRGKTTGGRSPWQLLEEILSGSKRAIMLFREYAAAFKGARQLTWSRGLREGYSLRDGLSDEDAADDADPEALAVAVMPKAAYLEIVDRGLEAELLEAVEARPILYTVLKFLRQRGISADDVERPTGRTFGPPGGGHGRGRGGAGVGSPRETEGGAGRRPRADGQRRFDLKEPD